MEFVGSLARPIMRPLFKIPGRSAINCAVAWVGSGTMGIVLTNKEYEDGFILRQAEDFNSEHMVCGCVYCNSFIIN